MTATSIPSWFNQQFTRPDGSPVAGGWLYTYAAGSSFQQTTYNEAGNANPWPLQFGADGKCQLRLTKGNVYKFRWYEADGVTLVDQRDNVEIPEDVGSLYDIANESGLRVQYTSDAKSSLELFKITNELDKTFGSYYFTIVYKVNDSDVITQGCSGIITQDHHTESANIRFLTRSSGLGSPSIVGIYQDDGGFRTYKFRFNIVTTAVNWIIFIRPLGGSQAVPTLLSPYDTIGSMLTVNLYDISDSSHLNTPQYIDFIPQSSQPSYQAGRLWQDYATGILSGYMGGTTDIVRFGEHTKYKVVNNTGVLLSKGVVGYINGASGQISTVSKASSTSQTANNIIGLIGSDLYNGNTGTLVRKGRVTGINTTSFTNGQTVYVSTVSGEITATKPANAIKIGEVTYSHATLGEILVDVSNANDYLSLTGGVLYVGTYGMMTDIGGMARKYTAGENLVKGELVTFSGSADKTVIKTPADSMKPIGVVFATASSGQPVYIVYSGPAQVLLQDSTASTRGYWARTSITVAGRADITAQFPPGGTVQALEAHSAEIGHCCESKTAGTNVLAEVTLHFN